MIHPLARAAGLLIETLDDEVLVYDTDSDRAHCLDSRSAAIWRACDGKRSVAEIAEVANLDEETAWAGLRSLDQAQLLEPRLPKRKRPTRRQALIAAAAVPLVLSISTPAAAQAASCVGFRMPCQPGGIRCCRGSCKNVSPFGFICVG